MVTIVRYSRGCRIEWYNIWWPWVTLTRVSRSLTPTSRISQLMLTKLLKNNNRKPYMIYRMVQLSMTLSDLWLRFQGHNISRHWISQKRHQIVHSYYRMSIWSHMRSIEGWHFQWPWRTPIPVFKVTHLLNGATFNDLERPLTLISRSQYFSTLNISETTLDSA